MRELDPTLYTIAWIAPLEIEAQAARHMLDNRHDGRFATSRGNDYIFSAGDINGHNIVIATLPAGQEFGTGSAAALASQIKMFFTNLWFGLLVGVAAGLPNLRKIPPIDIRLGDVLVGLSEGDSAGLVAYDLGKETTEGFQLLRSGEVLASAETVVRSAIGNIKIRAPDDTDVFLPFYKTIEKKKHSKGTFVDPGQEKDVFYDIDDDGVDSPVQRLQRPPGRRTRVWYGSIGSGDKLMKNTSKRNEIRDRYGVIGLEMEAAGTMNRIPVGVIRGVCDYADQHKNKEWQPYAAAMAAAYAKAVIYELGPGKVMPSSSLTNEAKHALCGTILCDLPPTTDRFFGREAELLEMIACLEATTQRKGIVLCGISGSGKTQLAREYVAQRRESFSAILWIDASSEESIEESFSNCSSRVCEHNPEYRVGRESTPPRQLVLEWLRTTPDKNWLTVIDNANGSIPNKRLLGPFMDMNHGSFCVISTNQVTARAVRLKQVLVEHLDASASQSLLLWRAYGDDTAYEADSKNVANRTAKLLGGFPLALELAGVLHQRGIIPLNEFATNFTKDYPELAQFEIDSGDPWKQLQALAQSKIKLNKAIDELSKIFLATKKQGNDYSLLSFSLHASICQWRLATMVDRDTWIIQATYSLSKHILSLHDNCHVFRFFNLFNRCLDLLWKHIDAHHIDIYGRFSKAYFAICLCGADVYLAMGKFEISKTLFISAIDYIRSSSPGDPDENILLRLLDGLARSCEKMREFTMAEEALLSAVNISERLNGHVHEQTASLVSRLKTVREYMVTDLENRKRALVASTGPKLTPEIKSTQAVSSSTVPSMELEIEEFERQILEKITARGRLNSLSGSSLTTATALPNLAWELRFSHPVLAFSLRDDGNDIPGLSDTSPMTIQGRLNIRTYESVDIKSIFIVIKADAMDARDLQGRRQRQQQAGDASYAHVWTLQLFEAITTPRVGFGDNCTFDIDDENFRENTRQAENDGDAMPNHIVFPPGAYSYSFESPFDCLHSHTEKLFHQDIDWAIHAVMEFPDFNHGLSIEKGLPVFQIPQQLMAKRTDIVQFPRQQNNGIPFCVNLPYEVSRIGGKLPIRVTLGPVNSGFRADYLTYFIVQRGKQGKQNQATQRNEQKLVLLERFTLEESTVVGDDRADEEETACSYDTSASPKSLFEEKYLPSLGSDEPVSISDDLMLPTSPFMEVKHFIQVTVGVSRPDPNKSGSRTQLETTEEIPITIIDCRITHMSDLLVDTMAYEPSAADNKETFCGCPDADSVKESVSWQKTRLDYGPTKAKLFKTTSIYTRKVYGKSKDDVRLKNASLEKLWNRPVQHPSKSQHWKLNKVD
ncbi:calcium-independent phospholipase [Fusarium denticulatum]|uniref:Calcium-independent phospholipase n=1 Tax=Fusarium denticulatum TaxID=48507 RepID=A0A8H5U177_9HYPO|nr:calcium-independent phospholipase [Fusarium denticulatum]